jgi:hypothetical protein
MKDKADPSPSSELGDEPERDRIAEASLSPREAPELKDAPADSANAASRKPKLTSLALALQILTAWLHVLQAWLAFMAEIGRIFGIRKDGPRPWHLHIARRSKTIDLTDAEVQRLLQQQRDLKDTDLIANAVGKYRLPESDFFADPAQIERLIRRILEANPPWLHISRTLSGMEQGSETATQEVLWREQVTQEMQDVTLYLPDENWRDLPLASLTMRPIRHLGEVWQARLLDQILPPEVILDRCNRGEIMIPVRNNVKHRLEFLTEQRSMEVTVRRMVPIAIETEGDSGQGGQLLYILMDFSASMRGMSATLALAAISAAMRANMGHRNTRYLFRRYAEQGHMWPSVVEPPVQARTLEEKDSLLKLIAATNFNGEATHVNHALDIAMTDVENLRREEHLEAAILLVTDGRAEMLESTGLRLRKTGVKVHTVMCAPEPNPSLAALSESFTILDIGPDSPPPAANTTAAPAAPAARRPRAYQI